MSTRSTASTWDARSSRTSSRRSSSPRRSPATSAGAAAEIYMPCEPTEGDEAPRTRARSRSATSCTRRRMTRRRAADLPPETLPGATRSSERRGLQGQGDRGPRRPRGGVREARQGRERRHRPRRTGGQLDSTARSGFVKEFSEPILDGNPQGRPDCMAPIKTEFGYHVVFWSCNRAARTRASSQGRAVDGGADFAAMAQATSPRAGRRRGRRSRLEHKDQLDEIGDAAFSLGRPGRPQGRRRRHPLYGPERAHGP